jgi:hypothetical protein
MSDRKGKEREPVDWLELSVAAINKHTTSPEFTAKYKAWLELREADLNDFEKSELATIRAEEAAKQAVGNR